MDVRLPRYAPVVLVFGLATANCDSPIGGVNVPSQLSSLSSSVTVEPVVVRPEFLNGGTCAVFSPFGLRLRVIVGAPRALMLRGLRFQLIDRSGTRALPEVIPTPSGAEAALPVPASPITIPGSSPITGLGIAAGTTQSLGFFLRFGCGIAPAGSLVVNTDLADGDGRTGTSEMRVRVE